MLNSPISAFGIQKLDCWYIVTYLPTGKILSEDLVTEMIRIGNWMPLEQRISWHYRAAGSGRMEVKDTKKNDFSIRK